jgi:hypothetical protein
MCHAVQCRICGKTTWSGCGLHVNAVKQTVPPEHWCDGHRDDKPASGRRSLFKKKR